MPTQKQVLIPTPLPHPLPPHLRTSLQSHLISASAVPKILTSLQSACEATGWEDKLQERVLEILREGEVGSRAEVLRRILGEVRGEGIEGTDIGVLREDGGGMGKGEGNDEGIGKAKGKWKEKEHGEANGNEKGIKKTNIRIPEEGIKEGMRIVRDVLETCVQIEPEKSEKGFWD